MNLTKQKTQRNDFGKSFCGSSPISEEVLFSLCLRLLASQVEDAYSLTLLFKLCFTLFHISIQSH